MFETNHMRCQFVSPVLLSSRVFNKLYFKMEDASAKLQLLSEVRWLYKRKLSKHSQNLQEEVKFF